MKLEKVTKLTVRCIKTTQGITKTSNLIRTTSLRTEMTTMYSLPATSRTPTSAERVNTRGVVTEVEAVDAGNLKINTTGAATIMISIRDRDMVRWKNHRPKEAEDMIVEALECVVDSTREVVETEVTSVGTAEVT